PSTNDMVRTLCATGRAFLPGPQMANPVILNWDEGAAWAFGLHIRREGAFWLVSGKLTRGEESMPLLEPRFISSVGIFSFRDLLARFEPAESFPWIEMLRREGSIRVPHTSGEELVKELMSIRNCPSVDWPEELKFHELRLTPIPRATFSEPRGVWTAVNAPV